MFSSISGKTGGRWIPTPRCCLVVASLHVVADVVDA